MGIYSAFVRDRCLSTKEYIVRHKKGSSAYLILITIVISLITINCNTGEETFPRIRYGEESCDRCRMIISEKRFASAYRTDDGILRKFDDLGCAVLHRVEQNEQVKQFWVYDYGETDWLDKTEAFFVSSRELLTPMGYGIIAVKTKIQAQSLAENNNGQIVEFDQLQHILQR